MKIPKFISMLQAREFGRKYAAGNNEVARRLMRTRGHAIMKVKRIMRNRELTRREQDVCAELIEQARQCREAIEAGREAAARRRSAIMGRIIALAVAAAALYALVWLYMRAWDRQAAYDEAQNRQYWEEGI